MSSNFQPPQRGWLRKFSAAFAGLWLGSRGQSSCVVHAIATVGVLIAAAVLRLERVEWCLLVLAIAGVWTAELFNSALEELARAITRDHDERIGRALDIASAAVLAAAIGAVLLGAIIFVPHLVKLFG